MTTVKNIILQTDFDSVAKEIEMHYGDEHITRIEQVYTKLKSMDSKTNPSNMVIFIRAIRENERGDDDIVLIDFDPNDSDLAFDVCGEDEQYDGLYSIASSEYGELLGYYIEQSTIDKFSYSQIIAHILWELEW